MSFPFVLPLSDALHSLVAYVWVHGYQADGQKMSSVCGTTAFFLWPFFQLEKLPSGKLFKHSYRQIQTSLLAKGCPSLGNPWFIHCLTLTLCSTTPTWVRPVPSHPTSTQGTIKPCWGPAGLHSIALGRFWYHHSLPSASWASLLEAPVRAPIQAGSYCPSPKVPPRSECMEHGALPSKNWVDAVCLSVNTSSNEVFKITLQIDQQIDHIHVVTTMGQGLWLWWRH